MHVVITAPHACVRSKSVDPTCDYGTSVFAEKTFAAVRALRNQDVKARMFVTDVARMDCDTNRSQCRSVSAMRRNLTQHLNRINRGDRPFLLLDIHSFGMGTGAFGYSPGTEPYVFLLALDDDTRLAFVLRKQLKSNDVSVVVIRGSTTNDIMYEAYRKGGYTVLIEFREEANVSSATFRRTMQAIQDTVRELSPPSRRSEPIAKKVPRVLLF